MDEEKKKSLQKDFDQGKEYLKNLEGIVGQINSKVLSRHWDDMIFPEDQCIGNYKRLYRVQNKDMSIVHVFSASRETCNVEDSPF